MGGPPAQYGYPAPGQLPAMGSFPGGPVAPRRTAGRSILAVVIGGLLLVLLIAGVLIVRALTSVTFAAQWYGQLQFTPAPGSSSPGYAGELYLNLSQDRAGSISGTGKVCANINGTVEEVQFAVTGSANGSHASLTLSPQGSTSGSPESATATLASDTMTITATDSSGTTAGTLHNGGTSAAASYTSACQTLPPVQTGG
jgi:hypothetical protein